MLRSIGIVLGTIPENVYSCVFSKKYCSIFKIQVSTCLTQQRGAVGGGHGQELQASTGAGR